MNLHWLDWLCIVVYLVFMLLLGGLFAGRQKTTKEYFFAGKSMGWLPISLAMFATLFSSISFVQSPGEGFREGLLYLTVFITYPVAAVVTIVFFIDFFVRLKISTVFEYLEVRFQYWLSMIIMTAYMLYRALYAGVVTFALALVLHVMTGMGLLPIIAVVGISTVIYTTLGGQRAVIWTDIAQFVIFFGGIILAFLIAIQKMPGGLPQILAIAGEANKLKLFDPSLSLTARYTTLTLLIMGFVDFLGSKSIDQLNVQRYLSTRTGADAKMAMLIQPLFAISIQFMLFALGVTLFAFYSFYPDPKVAMFVADKKIDQVFPYYILNVMPPGVKGLMIAALLAAAMSTLSAVMNMLSAIPITGIYKRIINPAAGDRRCVFLAKLLTVFWGIAITLLACCMLNIESVLQTCASITGLFIGPLLAIFVLGMFTRRANSGGVFLGLLAAFGVTLYLKNYTPLTFMLYGTCGLITAMITGYLASFFFAPPPSSKTKNLLWKWNGMKETFFGDGGVELHSLNIRIR